MRGIKKPPQFLNKIAVIFVAHGGCFLDWNWRLFVNYYLVRRSIIMRESKRSRRIHYVTCVLQAGTQQMNH
jgi:hypothetical protein